METGDLDSVSTRGETLLCGVIGDNRGFGAVGKGGAESLVTAGRFGEEGVSEFISAGESCCWEGLLVSIFGISTISGAFSAFAGFSFRFRQYLQHRTV